MTATPPAGSEWQPERRPEGDHPESHAEQSSPQQPGYPQSGYPVQQPTYPDYPGGPGGPPVPPSDPLVPANLGGWFEKVVGVIRRSFVPLLAIQIAAVVVTLILEVVVRLSGGSSAGTGLLVLVSSVIIFAIVNSFAQLLSIFVAIRDAAGESTSVGTALKFAAYRAGPFLGWGIVAGIMTIIMMGIMLMVIATLFSALAAAISVALTGSATLTGVVAMVVVVPSLLLLLLPLIYLMIVFGATFTGVVAVERKNIGRCFQLVNRRFWPTTGRLLLFFLFSAIYSLLVAVLVAVLVVAIGITDPNSLTVAVLVKILFIPSGIAFVAVALVTYAELRFRENPDVLTPTLAAELRR